MAGAEPGRWDDEAKVAWYLDRVYREGRREFLRAGDELLVDLLPPAPEVALDLGCGDGRLADLIMVARPSLRRVVALDVSPPMLARARERFADDPRVEVVEHDLAEPLEDLGRFDAVVAGFAIHHVTDERKQALYGEVARLLRPGGVFVNLEVVQSATPELHAQFLAAVDRDHDDPEDKLAPVEPQLAWLRAAGLEQVDCLWRWRGVALLAGVAPGA